MTSRYARTDLRRRAAALLDQQLWCWGRDVARPAGNLFLALGMCRYRTAEAGPDRTAYTGRVAGDAVVWLWGFGFVYCTPGLGGVFLRRSGFAPVLVEEPLRPVHTPEQLGPFTRPTTARQRIAARDLVRAAAEWVAGYEHWVAETLGAGYRESTLAARDRPPEVPAEEMARAWEQLARKSIRLSDSPPEPRGAWGRTLNALWTPSEVGPPRARGRQVPNTHNHRRFPTP
jgi:hypothetical protein